MSTTHFRYQLDDRPPVWLTLLYGMQWLAISIPFVIILGNAVAAIQYPGQPAMHIAYLQKSFFVTGLVLLGQLAAGHKLPLLIGPASVLLLGVTAGSADPGAVSGSIVIGGMLFALLGACNAASRVSALFTARIIGVVMLLIAFTMLPTIMRMITADTPVPLTNLLFALFLVMLMLIGQRALPGLAKSAMVLCSLAIGSLLYFLLTQSWPEVTDNRLFAVWGIEGKLPKVDVASLVAFLFCYIALWVNDLGSIQATGVLVNADNPARRVKRGLALTGAGNVLAGALGVIGPVNYSLSAGMILASGCASRYTMLPAAAGMLLLSFLPGAIGLFAAVPSPVIGSLLLYMMGSQIAGSFGALRESFAQYRFEDGLIIGIPLLLATAVSFLPAGVVSAMPQLLKPLLANGFVIGGVTAMFLEHVVFRQ